MGKKSALYRRYRNVWRVNHIPDNLIKQFTRQEFLVNTEVDSAVDQHILSTLERSHIYAKIRKFGVEFNCWLSGVRNAINARSKINRRDITTLPDDPTSFIIFADDYIFDSLSASAAVILARSAQGPKEWKNKNDVSLKDTLDK